ncbi:MAG: tRNA1(Val) (adenine(37)-N6)-methyltransferase [Lachnospiraceae bacterium]|nr:tRNA1(Val) (adenine(37)-N6)-methyltransferase [Lachnospiraceae bacterium]
MMNDLLPDERLDDLQCRGYHIIQNTKSFCFGMDAVLLANFAAGAIKKGQQVLDMGSGTAVIPILLAAKTEAAQLIGLEIQTASVEMSKRSVSLNELNDRITIVEGDIREAGNLFPAASFHAITCNPPYMTASHGLHNPYAPKNIARHEILCTLEDVVKNAAGLLVPGGSFYMVHKPFRLAEIMSVLLAYHLEPKRMQLVHPYVDKEPNMVLLQAVRGGKSRIQIEPPLILSERPPGN